MGATYTAKDIASKLGIALGNAYDLMRRVDFPSIRITPRRLIVTEEAFKHWLEEQAQAKKVGG